MIMSIRQSIRIQLITTFVVCALAAFLVSRATVPIFETMNREVTIDYSGGMQQINDRAQMVAEQAAQQNSTEAIKAIIDEENGLLDEGQDALKVLVTDEEGKVLYKTKQAHEERMNLHDMIKSVMSFAINHPAYAGGGRRVEESRKEFMTFYPVTIKGKNLYMFVSGIPEGDVIYSTSEGPIPIFIGLFVFFFSYFYITKRKMRQIEAMAQGVKEIAKGNLAHRIEKKGEDEIASLTENINHMAEELMKKIEKERKVERQKNELITNVSHDLRTPLTSIMGYLRLLCDGKYETSGQLHEYARVAFSKSEQLKNLIEDLFEYTKLTNENIAFDRQEVCMNELLGQLIEEVVPQAEEHGLSIVKEFPDERLYAVVDPEKMVRVFDNLLMNAIKYSSDQGEIHVSLKRQDNGLQVAVANQSESFTEEELENLFERFYKKDQARSRIEEGSGLGLAIAKSIVEKQEGNIWAEYHDGIVRFIIRLPMAN